MNLTKALHSGPNSADFFTTHREDKHEYFSFFRKTTSGNVAKDRLKILLISDRADCSPEIMEMIKTDIINVISKYMRIDENSTEIQITKTRNNGRGNKLPSIHANIPILDLRK